MVQMVAPQTDEVTITQNVDNPTPITNSDGVIDCTTTSYDLDGSSSIGNNLSYAWYNSLGDLVGTNALQTVTLSDTYTLLITDGANGCTASSEIIVTEDITPPIPDAGFRWVARLYSNQL